MTKRVSESHFYVAAAARFRDLIYVLARDKGLEQRDVEHSRFIGFYRGELGHIGDRNWRAVDLCVATKPDERMVAIGEDGQVLTYVGGAVSEETIKEAPVALRGVGVVDGFAWACGMKRQTYQRVGEGDWRSLHAPPPSEGENAGFEDIAGYSSNEMYAVGWNGEVWEWNGNSWVHRATPTNAILTSVCCGHDGNVYVCGQRGTLLCGRHDRWDLIEDEEVVEDLWSVVWFADHVYLASMSALYILDGNTLQPVRFEVEERPTSFYKLTQAHGVLWSVGPADVFALEDGVWTRID